MRILHFLFSGDDVTCFDAADSNDDGEIDVSDAVGLLSFLFRGSLPPPAPFPGEGADPTADSLDCRGD